MSSTVSTRVASSDCRSRSTATTVTFRWKETRMGNPQGLPIPVQRDSRRHEAPLRWPREPPRVHPQPVRSPRRALGRLRYGQRSNSIDSQTSPRYQLASRRRVRKNAWSTSPPRARSPVTSSANASSTLPSSARQSLRSSRTRTNASTTEPSLFSRMSTSSRTQRSSTDAFPNTGVATYWVRCSRRWSSTSTRTG